MTIAVTNLPVSSSDLFRGPISQRTGLMRFPGLASYSG